MLISRDAVVNLRYRLACADDPKLRDELPVLAAYIHGRQRSPLSGMSRHLEGQRAGAQLSFVLPPEDAFGARQERLVFAVPRRSWPFAGETLADRALCEGGVAAGFQLQVLGRSDEGMLVDGNHPFAGHPVRVECEVLGVRAATTEELERGWVLI